MSESQSLIKPTLLTWLVFIIIASLSFLRFSTDYLGPDNDDVMRLVQVRDWLGGQEWFDLTQYRLGPEGGTLMHWSRLVDLPIAGLIGFFSMFFAVETAEMIAVYMWPLITAIPVILSFILCVRALAGPQGVAVGAIASIAFLVGVGKFNPGAIDHHNIQLSIYALLIFIVIEPSRSRKLHILGGFLCAFAIAIGAETTPLIAVICAIIALAWAWNGGKTYRRPTRAFGLSMAFSLTLLFFITVPAARYTEVVCDTLSLGYYALGVAGSGLLFLAAATLSYKSRLMRFASLGGIGAITLVLAKVIAPECLQSPLANLDPLLVELWLSNVTEAQSFVAQWQAKPWSIFGFYAVPIMAIMFCIYQLNSGEHKEAYLKLLFIILVAFAISLIQTRGSVFANLAAMIPMAVFVSQLRMQNRADPKNTRLAISFILVSFLSMPIIWAAIGGSISKLTDPKAMENEGIQLISQTGDSHEDEDNMCKTREALMPLNELPTGVVVAPSNLGASILRYTQHRVLSAPYHRNQFGMLAEIKASISSNEEARKILNNANATILVFCGADPQVSISKQKANTGFYAKLSNGEIPKFLNPLLISKTSAVKFYKIN